MMSGAAGGWAGPGGGGDGGGVVVMAYFRCLGGGAVPCRAALHKARAGAKAGQLPRHRPKTMMGALLLHGPARKWIDLLCALLWAFRPVSRKTAAAAGITRWATNTSGRRSMPSARCRS